VLLTNSSAEATALKLEALAITHRFGAVVTTDTLGVGKPDPRTYLEACRLAGTRPSETVCIGDNLEWDVFGARSAGLRAVWIDRDGGVHRPAVPPVPTVRSLDELTTVLKKGRFGQPPRDG
ncbi:MAG TPA: HAD family hydrolase, partial [Dermatophilaceae bacterium]|nr:HAD family hydrolase [Dermatophilaceae bacterium]